MDKLTKNVMYLQIVVCLLTILVLGIQIYQHWKQECAERAEEEKKQSGKGPQLMQPDKTLQIASTSTAASQSPAKGPTMSTK